MNQTNTTGEPAVQRTYKSRMFEMIFSNKRELLELYNAMHGTHYDDPELLEINTLENAITECIRENILSDFLTKNRAEAKSVSIYEYNEEKHMRQTREEGLNEGIIRGCIETFQELQIPQDTVIHRLMEKFNLTSSEADSYIAQYWK